MKPERHADYLDHMVDAVQTAITYVQGMDEAAFLSDRRTQQAVLHNLIVLGEAATLLSRAVPDLAQQFPDIPWASLRGMRNRVAHGYFDIDLGVVWATLQRDLPGLLVGLSLARQRLGGH